MLLSAGHGTLRHRFAEHATFMEPLNRLFCLFFMRTNLRMTINYVIMVLVCKMVDYTLHHYFGSTALQQTSCVHVRFDRTNPFSNNHRNIEFARL